MTKEHIILEALGWLEKNHAHALEVEDFSLADAIHDKIWPLYEDLTKLGRDEEYE